MEINSTLNYLGISAVSLGSFYILYHFLFRTGHHFRFNRILILAMTILPFVLPFVSFDFNKGSFAPINQFGLQQLTHYWPIGTVEINQAVQETSNTYFNLFQWLFLLYCCGASVFLIRYAVKLLSLKRLIRQNELIKRDNYYYVKLKEGQSTFSFRDYIFTNQESLRNENDAMFLHEQCHVDQRHTYDLLAVELLLALQWFNPFIYLFKNRLVEIHEFLADESVIQSGYDKSHYLKLLFRSANKNSKYEFTSQFNSIIYKRIRTMNTDKKIEFKVWKLIFPIALGALVILVHSGFKNQSFNPITNQASITNSDLSDEKPLFSQPIKKEDLIRLTSGYGMRMHPILKKEMMHKGIDYSADPGVKIYAASGGIVRKAQMEGKYGNLIIIDHGNGFSTLYAQMLEMKVKKGDKVSSGDMIGTVGSSGMSTAPHLHFEIMKDGEHVNPIDYLEPYQQ